jgi:hypothetical protein
MWPFGWKAAERLGDYFEPLADIVFPAEILFLGSGATPPEKGWKGVPLVRINEKTLDFHGEHPIFAVISQILSTPKVLKHPLFATGETPWLWQFMNELSLEKSKEIGERPIAKYRLVGTSGLRRAEPYRGLGSRFTTGSLVCLFLLHCPARKILLAGYDGYAGPGPFLRADGKRWHGRHHGHDLAAEWRMIEASAEAARAAGKEVLIAKTMPRPACP